MAAGRADQVPAPLLARIIEVWCPEEVRLFGSHARGEAHSESDWDLAVIVADDAPDRLLDAIQTRRAIRDLGFPVDLIPVRRSEYQEGALLFGSLAQIIEDEGQVVYAR